MEQKPSKLEELALTPSIQFQCLGFMIGSTFFAIGAAPGMSELIGAHSSNVSFFIGSWFFTAAAFIQLRLSEPDRNSDGALRASWLAGGTQFLGTLLFNVSTGSAIYASSYLVEKDLVWTPNAGGSFAFLISGGFLLLVLAHSKSMRGPISIDWFSDWVNMLGCIAFGLAAIGAIALPGGGIADNGLATWGTFIGAICFFLSSAVILPAAGRGKSRHRRPLGPFRRRDEPAGQASD